MRWRMPGNYGKFKGVQYYYEDGKYRAEIYERKNGRQDWWWRVFKGERLIDVGVDLKLYQVKHLCNRVIEISKENESEN